MRYRRLVLSAVLLLGLVACASGPRYDTSGLDPNRTAATVAAAPAQQSGARVVWGGIVITTRNQSGYSEMEILSYPLDSAQRPDTGRSEQGRFLVRYDGYLEAVDYAPGRQITITGRIDKVLQGKVGEAPYTFPLVQAEQLYLWPIEAPRRSEPQFHFGIGVIFGR